MNLQIKGAIFDADGTLLNSMHIWNELGQRYLNSLNIKPEENLSRILYFMSLEQSCSYLKEKYNLKFSVSEIQNGIINIIKDFYIHEVNLKKGVKNFLENLKLKNIPMVIATSGDRNLLLSALKRLNIKNYFNKIFTCSELNTTKHEAKIFLECSKFLKLEPEYIAVFEDALFALKTAKNSGFITFGIEDNSNIFQREEIIEISDFYIKTFEGENIL